jgi:hypothetical protein
MTAYVDIVAKRFCAFERATLIQDQRRMRNVDSKIRASRFDCCIFVFYSFPAATFATKSAHIGGATSQRTLPLLKLDRLCRYDLGSSQIVLFAASLGNDGCVSVPRH